ncbi:MAG: M24 family metallopeptidase [Gemmatimonadota bacterium]
MAEVQSERELAPTLTRAGVEQIQAALQEADLDGWLLYEFHGQNAISQRLLGVEWSSRRGFALIPARGEPRALIHAIEASSWKQWPWDTRSYSGWKELEGGLRELLDGCQTVAMETSPGSAVPAIDRVPGGILDLVRSAGPEVVSSGDLVSLFHSVWTPRQREIHTGTAATVARVAREAMDRAAQAATEGEPLREGEVARWILHRFGQLGLHHEQGCIVAIGPTASDPHYAPAGDGEAIVSGQLLLVDLWAKPGLDDVPADQTWMGFLGEQVPLRIQRLWEAVRDARDAALTFLEEGFQAGREVRGFEVDDACRAVIEARGYGQWFTHRTGHSIDRELHGTGPNLDHLESQDVRRLLPGVGFSVEPGIYIPGEVGIRTEVNVFWGSAGPEVTTPGRQGEIFLLPG